MNDRDLVRLYWPVELRPAFDALLDLDEAMAEVVAKSSEPALGAIKLAWWRERLQELDEGKAPAEPRLQAAAAHLLTRGITGQELAGLEDGWATLLEEEPDAERIARSGARLFELGARLLGASDPLVVPAGRLWACQQVTRRGLARLGWAADGRTTTQRVPKALRPLTALAALAARDAGRGADIEPQGTPGRALALIRHRISGRLQVPVDK